MLSSGFLSGSDRSSETSDLPKDPYRVHIDLNGAAGPLQDPLLQLAAFGAFLEHICVIVIDDYLPLHSRTRNVSAFV